VFDDRLRTKLITCFTGCRSESNTRVRTPVARLSSSSTGVVAGRPLAPSGSSTSDVTLRSPSDPPLTDRVSSIRTGSVPPSDTPQQSDGPDDRAVHTDEHSARTVSAAVVVRIAYPVPRTIQIGRWLFQIILSKIRRRTPTNGQSVAGVVSSRPGASNREGRPASTRVGRSPATRVGRSPATRVGRSPATRVGRSPATEDALRRGS
jgi:hypothetical protein